MECRLENLAGLMIRLLTIRSEFGDAAFEQATHSASIAIARDVLHIAEQRAVDAARPTCIVIPFAIVSSADDDLQ